MKVIIEFLARPPNSVRLGCSIFRCNSPVIGGLRIRKRTRTPESSLKEWKIEEKQSEDFHELVRNPFANFRRKSRKTQPGILVVVRLLLSKDVFTNSSISLAFGVMAPKSLVPVDFMQFFHETS